MFTEDQILTYAPDDSSIKAGKSLVNLSLWENIGISENAIWGSIKGSGSKPYLTQVDIKSLAFKCSCPSRKFPCKHGLAMLLLFARNENSFTKTNEEPEWVSDWIEKRRQKSSDSPQNTEKEVTPELKEKQEKQKQKTQENREKNVEKGVDELNRILQDWARIGILDFAHKPNSYFTQLGKRFIDAQIPAIAAYMNRLSNLPFYASPAVWRLEACEIIAELNFLVKTYKNKVNLTPLQQTQLLQNLGYSQSTKDLLSNPNAEVILDDWLVIGQETVESDDKIVTQKNWLYGINTQNFATILHFSSRFNPEISPLINGMVLQAGICYFEAATPNRAVIKLTKDTLPYQHTINNPISTLNELKKKYLQTCLKFPLQFDFPFILNNVRAAEYHNEFIVVDEHNNYLFIHRSMPIDKQLEWIAMSEGATHTLAGIYRKNKLVITGIFKNNKFYTI